MIQVDVFWSFAMGACLASLAADGLLRASHIFINKYFVYTVCYLSMVFAPSGIYLLWQHTAWETMFFLDRSLHGLWPCLFAHTNVSLGVLGFVVCYRLVRAGYRRQVHVVWTGAYTAMFAILTFGYDRFLYAGSEPEWGRGVQYSVPWDFFSSEVFRALLVMSVFVLPPLFYAMVYWPSEHGLTPTQKSVLISDCVTPYYRLTALVITSYLAALLAGLPPATWGLDRLYAFLIGQCVFGAMLFLPLFAIPVDTVIKGSAKVIKKQK